MAKVQMIMFLFTLLVSSTITIQGENTMAPKALRLCNFFKEVGFRCIGCHEGRICLPLNIGFTWTCGNDNPYCNNGFCSKTKGSMCSSETAEKSDSSTSSSASEGNATACTSESSKSVAGGK